MRGWNEGVKKKKKKRQRAHLFPLEQRTLLDAERFEKHGNTSGAAGWFLGSWGLLEIRLWDCMQQLFQHITKTVTETVVQQIQSYNNKQDSHTVAERLLLLASIPLHSNRMRFQLWKKCMSLKKKKNPIISFYAYMMLSLNTITILSSFFVRHAY